MGRVARASQKEKNMTLFRQFAIMLAIFTSILLLIVVSINFQSAKSEAKERLYDEAKNSATTLSLTLGSVNGDIDAMKVMISANFDSGNYSKIALIDIEQKSIFERVNESSEPKIPLWFKNLLDIQAPNAFANVSAGWNQIGILEVVANTNAMEVELYKNFKKLLTLFIGALVGGFVVLYFILYYVLKPLKEIHKQAIAVGNNQFLLQEKIPYIVELKDIVMAINSMVTKLKTIFETSTKELKALKESEYTDKDTKLKNRTYFVEILKEHLGEEAIFMGGSNVFIHLEGVAQANAKLGRLKINELYLKLIEIFKRYSKTVDESLVVRMAGVEFSILLPNTNLDESTQIVKNIQKDAIKVIQAFGIDSEEFYLVFGIYEYTHKNSIGEFFAASDDALSQATLFDDKIFAKKSLQNDAPIMGKEEWRETIIDSIHNDKFECKFWDSVDKQSNKTIHKIATITLNIDEKRFFNYAAIMSHAIQSQLVVELYGYIINKLFKKQTQLDQEMVYAFRLPKEFLEHKDAFEFLERAFSSNTLSKNIIIELSDRFLHSDSIYIYKTIKLLKAYNVNIGVYDFIGESSDFNYLELARVKYIKMEAGFIISQSHEVLNSIKTMANSLNITLIATGVNTQELLDKVINKEVFIVQGAVNK